jgi:hypothetical protein
MTNLLTLEEVKKMDKKLYEEALRDHPTFVKDEKKLNSFIAKADHLLEDLKILSNQVKSIEDYNWLNEAALKWQVIYSSILNIPKDIQIYLPSQQLESPLPSRPFTDEELKKWLKQRAYTLSINRRFNKLLKEVDARQKRASSNLTEIHTDWHQAEVEFTYQVMDGEIDFVRQISAKSYPQFERIWLREVKHFRAYQHWEENWEQRGNNWDLEMATADYYAACEEIRGMLVNREIKKPAKDFEEVKAYLESQYLKSGGTIDEQNNAEVKGLLAKKAYESSQSSGEEDEMKNWGIASVYVKLFYENIIPAVMDDDFGKTWLVLKAFQYNAQLGNRHRIIDSFEVILAIYFLNPDHIEEIWNNAEGYPPPSSLTESTVAVSSWPANFSVPKECQNEFRFDPENKQLIFEGSMAPSQKNALLKKLSQPDHIDAVERLYRQSRSIPRLMIL